MYRSQLHTGFPRDILYETLARGLPEVRWIVGGSSKSLGEHPLSHWTLCSGCNQHALCFWFSYMLCMSRTSHPSTPSLWRAHQITCLGTWSNAFSRLTKAMFHVLLTAQNICCNWRTMDMASVVLHPGKKTNCMSSMCTCCHMNFSATFSRTFMTWFSNLRPWYFPRSRATPLPLLREMMILCSLRWRKDSDWLCAQVTGSLFKTGVANDQVSGHDKLQ